MGVFFVQIMLSNLKHFSLNLSSSFFKYSLMNNNPEKRNVVHVLLESCVDILDIG